MVRHSMPSDWKRRTISTFATCSLVLGFVVTLGADEAAFKPAAAGGNWPRLLAMSRDQRVHLAGRLTEYDALDPATRSRIQQLDGEINKLPPQNRTAAYSVMRRFHLWIESLSDSDRNELLALSTDQRMVRVRTLLKMYKVPDGDLPADFHPVVFGPHSSYEMATQIKTWLALPQDRRSAIMNLKEADRTKALHDARIELKIAAIPKPPPTPADDQYAQERWKAIRNELNLPTLKKFDDPSNTEFQEKKARRLRRIAENKIFERQKVEKVRTDRLIGFSEEIPPWFRTYFDRLAPDHARQYLTLLYRLVYPPPSEFVPTKVVAKSANPGKAQGVAKKAEPGKPSGKQSPPTVVPEKKPEPPTSPSNSQPF